MQAPLINVHAVLPRSRVNGPGTRLVVFFQGCARACPGCFNPDTHTFEKRRLLGAADILRQAPQAGVEGITVSGGEPFMQPRGLFSLLSAARQQYGLTVVVYTGFEMEELEKDPDSRACLGLIDVLIDGPYVDALREPTLLARGSTNQRLRLLTGRYGESDFYMPGRLEVVISSGGLVTQTGFSSINPRN